MNVPKHRKLSVSVEVRQPIFVRAFWGVATIATSAIALWGIWRAALLGSRRLGVDAIAAVLIAGLAAALCPLIFRRVAANSEGVTITAATGYVTSLKWADIRAITMPRFGIPRDVAYLECWDGRWWAIIKSSSGFTELLQMRETYTGVEPNQAAADSLQVRRSSGAMFWLGVLITIVFVCVRFSCHSQ